MQDVIDRWRRKSVRNLYFYIFCSIHTSNKQKQQHQSSSENLSDVVESERRSSLRRQNSTEATGKKQQQKPKLNIDRFLRRQASSSSSKLNGKRVVSRSFANSWISDRSYSMTPTNKSKNVVIRRGRVKKRKKNENSHWKDVEALIVSCCIQKALQSLTIVSLNRNNINRAFFWAHSRGIFSFTKMKKKSKINVEDIETVTCKEGEDEENNNCNEFVIVTFSVRKLRQKLEALDISN